jgi:hypothetical protein
MRRPKLVLASGAAAVAAVLAGGLVFGSRWAVRSALRSAADRHRLDVGVDEVRVGWFEVDLKGLEVRPRGVPIAVRLRDVRVELSTAFAPIEVVGHGGDVRIVGSRREVEDAVRAWRGGDQVARAGASRDAPISVDGLTVQWVQSAEAAPSVTIEGGSLSRSDGKWKGSLDSANFSDERAAVEISGARATFSPPGVLDEAQCDRFAVDVAAPRRSASPASTATGSDPGALQPVPLPVADKGSSGEAGATLARGFPLPDLHVIRARLDALGLLARGHLADDARVQVESLALVVTDGERHLTIGRGPFALSRTGTDLRLTFRTQASTAGTPVSVTADLPLDAGDATLSMEGGPISLALLGVDEGALGLVEVAGTTLTARGRAALATGGDSLTFDGDLSVRGLAIDRPELAAGVIRGVDATAVLRGLVDDKGTLRLDDAELSLGALRFLARGSVEQAKDHLAASLAFELPGTDCEPLLQSIPSALVPTLDGAEATGAFGLRGRLAFDSRKLDDLVLDWKTDDRCTLSTVPEVLSRDRFTQPFEHTIYLPDGSLDQVITGPTTDDWTGIDRISPFMQVAVLTTEDGGFYRHHGFNRAAMRNALVADLKAGRFARGASTITMQLAKNLFLSRDKTLSRKLEEVILADYLEQAFTKKELMELYLNVIEFGPNVYGITQAAFQYFGRKPDELDVAECLFLSSILPSPIRFHKLAEKPKLSDSWTRHVRELMVIAAKRGMLSSDELAEGVKEEIVFHDPNAPLPPPRASVTGTHFQATLDEGAQWVETPGP